MDNFKDKITGYVESLTHFFKETWGELIKVTWPTQQDVVNFTVVVIIAVFIIAFYLGLIDVMLTRGINLIIAH